ncbi:MAG: hypothetical protein OXG39_09160 [Chloroflexi bacterium]|nr:hypothetical protein [Chloroflexota bacterium]
MRYRFCCLALALIWVAGCGTLAKPSDFRIGQPADRPLIGRWTLEYTGGCAGREAEAIQVSRLDDEELVFDDFHLRRNREGIFEGSAEFIAPMPADGRDVVYIISYALHAREDDIFVGTETITEDGGASLGCPIQLVFAGA